MFELQHLVLVGDVLEYEVKGILWHRGKRAQYQCLVLKKELYEAIKE